DQWKGFASMTTNAVANFANRPPGAGGRPLGARTRLSHKLVEDLSEIWDAEGPGVLKKMAMRDPVSLARMAYATLPKDILVSVEQRIPGGLDPDDWALLATGLKPDQRCHSAGQQCAAGGSLRRD